MNILFRCKAEQKKNIFRVQRICTKEARTFRIYIKSQKCTLCICLFIHWIWQNLCSFASKAFLFCMCVCVCVCRFENNIGCCYCYYENKIVQLAKWVICQSVCRVRICKQSMRQCLSVCVCAHAYSFTAILEESTGKKYANKSEYVTWTVLHVVLIVVNFFFSLLPSFGSLLNMNRYTYLI